MNDQHDAVIVGIDRYPGLSDLTACARTRMRSRTGWSALGAAVVRRALTHLGEGSP